MECESLSETKPTIDNHTVFNVTLYLSFKNTINNMTLIYFTKNRSHSIFF